MAVDLDIDIVKNLKILMNIFDDFDKQIKIILSLEEKYKDDLELLKNMDISDPKMIHTLQEKFSKEQLVTLMQAFYQFWEFESKFKLVMDDRAKEPQEIQKLIKGIRYNLHKVLDD